MIITDFCKLLTTHIYNGKRQNLESVSGCKNSYVLLRAYQTIVTDFF